MHPFSKISLASPVCKPAQEKEFFPKRKILKKTMAEEGQSANIEVQL
jgi:hypothetical protein